MNIKLLVAVLVLQTFIAFAQPAKSSNTKKEAKRDGKFLPFVLVDNHRRGGDRDRFPDRDRDFNRDRDFIRDRDSVEVFKRVSFDFPVPVVPIRTVAQRRRRPTQTKIIGIEVPHKPSIFNIFGNNRHDFDDFRRFGDLDDFRFRN